MPSLEDEIDDLYKLPLTEFTGARNALVKRVRGADATHVRKLEKPTVLAWAVNQVHWRARPLFDRVMKTGERLRDAQLAALTGKSIDLRETVAAHRKAIADAVKEAERLASEAGSHPAPDSLMRTFEALSLAKDPPARAGRLTDALQPAGFEALAGVTPRASGDIAHRRDTGAVAQTVVDRDRLRVKDPKRAAEEKKRAAEEERTRAAQERKRLGEAKKRAAEERKHAAAVGRAEAALERAKAKLRDAEAALRRTQVRS